MKPTILFVDDESNVRESVRRVLKREPYNVVTVESAQQCVETLAATDVQVLITDLAMPRIDGRALINYFKDIRSDVVRIVLSGKLDLATTVELTGRGEVFLCLEKPCHASTLLRGVRDALEYWRSNNSDTTAVSEGESRSPSSGETGTTPESLISDALEEVERLEQSLERYRH